MVYTLFRTSKLCQPLNLSLSLGIYKSSDARTPEVQTILKLYIETLKRDSGWLFSGYGEDHLRPAECESS